jgi:2-dehydropantoate 2-reductase
MSPPHIIIAGAGSIGCYVGGLLASGGHRVTLLGRPRILDEIAAHGLTLTDFTGGRCHVAPGVTAVSDVPDCLRDADLILVTVKTGATGDIARQIAEHAPPDAPVISLQNGMDAIATLRGALPGRDVRAGMVPFNVVPMGQGRFHRATSGDILIETGAGGLGELLSVPLLTVAETPDITAVQWGKLLINLNNALNALSGLTVREQLASRDWRRLMADQMAEALAVFRANGIAAKSTTPVPVWLIPHILRLPTPLFRRIAAQMLTIDPTARTSMSYDLMQGRPTEIDALQGVIVDMAGVAAVPVAINAHVAAIVRDAEAAKNGLPNLTPNDIRAGV